MPKGLTRNSSPIQISGKATQTAINAFASTEIDLTLNALDQEVFVVTQVNIDLDAPDLVDSNPGGVSATFCTVSSTDRGSVGDISNSNVIAQAKKEIESLVIVKPGPPPVFEVAAAVAFDREDPLFAAQTEDYIGIIATSNCFLNIFSNNCQGTKGAAVRIYGYRAKMDAAGYAALVQSQVLSS